MDLILGLDWSVVSSGIVEIVLGLCSLCFRIVELVLGLLELVLGLCSSFCGCGNSSGIVEFVWDCGVSSGIVELV